MTKFIVSIVARKKLLLLLIGLWLAASTAGYFIGASDNKKALSRAAIYHSTNIRPQGAKVFLDYTCNDTKIASYDIRNHHVHMRDDLSGSTDSSLKGAFAHLMTGLENAAGGGLGTGLVHVILSKPRGLPRQAPIRLAAAGVVLAASGALYVGHQIGSQHQPDCNDTEILREISHEDFWKPAAKFLADNLWQQANDLANRNEISSDRRPVLDDALAGFEKDPSDSFNTLLAELGDKYRKYEPHPVQWTSVDFLIFATVMICITVLLGYFLPALSEAPASPKKPRKSKRQLKD
jgi:hypothetical protein